jgi:hypothetical protein
MFLLIVFCVNVCDSNQSRQMFLKCFLAFSKIIILVLDPAVYINVFVTETDQVLHADGVRGRGRHAPPAVRVLHGERAAARAPGTDFTNLHFGRKTFGQIFILKVWTKFHPDATNKPKFI